MSIASDLFVEVISAYTRSQAIEDGELIDVSDMAKKSGFQIPVAVTRAVWNQYIEWTKGDSDKQTHQDQPARLWDVLWMLYLACRRGAGESFLVYQLYVIPRDGRSRKPKQIDLKAIIGGGDNGEAVITIMLPNED